ncbi:MAG: hypothetical protein ACRD2L_23600 [Terriglobia bacterium]
MPLSKTMTQVGRDIKFPALAAFGRAFLDYVRNLTPQVILLATGVVAHVQAASMIADKWKWQAVALTCLVAAGVSTFFNIAFFIRDAAIAAPRSASWITAKVVAVVLAVVVPLAFVGAAVFNARSLLRSMLANVAG